MAQSSWPFQGVDTTETQYSRLLRHILKNGRSGVNGLPGDNNLKVIADSTGMNVKVQVSGGNSQAVIRGHMYNSTAQETLTIATANTNPRIDTVVLTLDPSVNSIVLAVVQGTAAASPSAPTLTQTDTAIYQFPLANVLVAANATTIDPGAVTDRREFVVDCWTTSTRPAAFAGLIGYNTTISHMETYNGSAWKQVAFDGDSIVASQLSSGEQLNLNVGKINGSRILVQEAAPSSPLLNDIHLW
jgi:hypothetical protein